MCSLLLNVLERRDLFDRILSIILQCGVAEVVVAVKVLMYEYAERVGEMTFNYFLARTFD